MSWAIFCSMKILLALFFFCVTAFAETNDQPQQKLDLSMTHSSQEMLSVDYADSAAFYESKADEYLKLGELNRLEGRNLVIGGAVASALGFVLCLYGSPKGSDNDDLEVSAAGFVLGLTGMGLVCGGLFELWSVDVHLEKSKQYRETAKTYRQMLESVKISWAPEFNIYKKSAGIRLSLDL